MSDTHQAQEAEVVVRTIDPEIEVKARRLGWVSAEEFRGDPAKHRSAEEYIRRGESLLPFVQKDNEKLHRKLTETENEIRELKSATKELLSFTTKAEERAYKRAKDEIEAKITTAASNADTAAAEAGVKELTALNEEHAKPAPKAETKPAVQLNPVIQDWLDKNEWYAKDPELGGYATAVFGKLQKAHPGMSTSDVLAEVKRKTVEKFPEEFGINPAREGAAAVASPSGQAIQRKKAGKTFEDLPADAKAACNKFVKTISGYTKEQYCKDYDWGD